MNRQLDNERHAVQRIIVELAEFKADLDSQTMCHFEPESESDVLQLKGHIYGPPDTPYQGGVFHLKISVPQDYPFRPPACKMITKVWHPNISIPGNICMDRLKENWAPAMSMRALLITIQALLSSVEDLSPHDTKTAAFWTYHYAVVNKTEQMITENAPFEAMISQVMAQKDADYEKALVALSFNGWNIQLALNNFERCFR